MRVLRQTFFCLLGSAVLAGVAGCETTDSRLGSPYVQPAASSVSSGFLRSNYPSLEAWMDQRFSVSWKNMTLDVVFEQEPINGVKYRFEDVAQESPLFYLSSSNISRREILKKIADFYDLNMKVEFLNGKPAYVLVKGDAVGSGFDPNDARLESIPVQEL